MWLDFDKIEQKYIWNPKVNYRNIKDEVKKKMKFAFKGKIACQSSLFLYHTVCFISLLEASIKLIGLNKLFMNTA